MTLKLYREEGASQKLRHNMHKHTHIHIEVTVNRGVKRSFYRPASKLDSEFEYLKRQFKSQ